MGNPIPLGRSRLLVKSKNNVPCFSSNEGKRVPGMEGAVATGPGERAEMPSRKKESSAREVEWGERNTVRHRAFRGGAMRGTSRGTKQGNGTKLPAERRAAEKQKTQGGVRQGQKHFYGRSAAAVPPEGWGASSRTKAGKRVSVHSEPTEGL